MDKPALMAPQNSQTGIRPSWTAVGLAALVSFGITLLVGMVVLSGYPKVSPIDELQHIDAAIKAAEGHWILTPGERIGQEAMRIEACAGIDAAMTPPPCDSQTFDPASFQELGINTAAGRPSTFYVVTGYLARLLGLLTGGEFFRSARIVSLLMHCLGVALLAALATRVSRSAVIGASVAVVAGLLPPVLSQSVTVNPDSWSYLATTIVVTLSLVLRDKRPLVAIPALTGTLVLLVLVKGNFAVLVVIPVLLYLLGGRASSLKGALHATVVPAVSALAVVVFLVLLQVWTTVTTPADAPVAPMSTVLAQSPTNPWNWVSVANQTVYNLVPTTAPGIADPLEAPYLGTISLLAGAFLFGVCVVGVFSAILPSLQLAFAWSALAVLIAAPALTFGLMAVSGLFFGYPQRYGFPAIPLCCLAWAAIPSQRRVLVAGSATAMLGSLALVLIEQAA